MAAEHGTMAGYHREWRAGKVPCRACTDAEAAYQKQRRHRQVAEASRVLGRPVTMREAARGEWRTVTIRSSGLGWPED